MRQIKPALAFGRTIIIVATLTYLLYVLIIDQLVEKVVPPGGTCDLLNMIRDMSHQMGHTTPTEKIKCSTHRKVE